MPVEDLLGFRANEWAKDDDGRWYVRSPMYDAFRWDSKIVIAECSIANNRRIGRELSLNDQNHSCYYEDELLYPGETHSCGIYATLAWQTLKTYYHWQNAYRVMYLVECIGGFVACQDTGLAGWRGGGAEVIAVVNPRLDPDRGHFDLSPHEFCMYAAAERYGVKVIPLQVAAIMARTQWESKGLTWTNAMLPTDRQVALGMSY